MLCLLVLIPLLAPSVSAAQSGTYYRPGERIVYGDSGEGRPLEAWRYGTGENVLIMGFAIHGYEDGFPRDGQCLVDCAHVLMNHLSRSRLVDGYNWTVYILPCMNPDGLYSGTSAWGAGRCTTTYLRSDGTLSTAEGIDLNRCFPTGFTTSTDRRHFVSYRPMAALEALALDAFLREARGSGKNVLIDVHGWLNMGISSHEWLMDIFKKAFPGMGEDYGDNRPGHLIAHGDSLGYQSLLMEFPGGIYSMAHWERSDIPQRMIRCLDAILRQGDSRCDGDHFWRGDCLPPTKDRDGYKSRYCLFCGEGDGMTLPACPAFSRRTGATPPAQSGTVTLG